MEPLNLTPENCESLRALVRKLTPNFEKELWDKVSLREAQQREMMEKMAQAAQMMQAQQALPNGLAGAMQGIPPTWMGSMGSNTTLTGTNFPGPFTTSSSNPIYQPVGTGFSTYGPLLPDQGLTLNKWMQYQ